MFRQRCEGILSIKCKLYTSSIWQQRKRNIYIERGRQGSLSKVGKAWTLTNKWVGICPTAVGGGCLRCFCDVWCRAGWMSSCLSGHVLLSSSGSFSSSHSCCDQSPKVLCSAHRSLLYSLSVTSFIPMASTCKPQTFYLAETPYYRVHHFSPRKSTCP